MAKEQTTDIKTEKFYLTDRVRNEGYHNRNYGIAIDFERDFEGRRTSPFACPGKGDGKNFVSEKTDFLTGLTAEQVYNLSIAKVIKIKKDQWHYFIEYLKTIKRIVEDD